MGAFVGIDLGTTYSVVAYMTPDGKPQAIPDDSGKTTVPSVVAFVGGTPLVGWDAKEQQAMGVQDVASFFKRNMGNPNFLLGFQGREYTPTDLSALVLAKLKAQAEAFLHTPVTDAVITVPAYFTHLQRAATIEAGRRAGLNVLSIISEPTAAALAYGLRPSQQAQKVLVYDLGGGTFDVSFVEITFSALRVIGTDGDHELGGKDWDDRLINYLQLQFQNEHGLELIGDDFNELMVQAEKLKHALSARDRAEVRVQGGGQQGTYSVSRAQFEEMTRDLLERTQLLTENVLRDANSTWADLYGVIPVGGSTRMPMVREMIQQMSGKAPMGGVHPDEAVALGAAIQAALDMEQRSQPPQLTLGGRAAAAPTFTIAGRKQVQDVIAHSLGMIATSQDGLSYFNSILIPKNNPIPDQQTRPYQLAARRGSDMKLEVFLTQGETSDPQTCAYLGLYSFSGFPPLHPGSKAAMDITYHYDRNGVVQVSAVERSTGTPLYCTVLPVPPDVPARFLGRPIDQQVREPITVYLVIDVSGSMEGNPLKQAQKAAENFVKECDLTNTSVGLISFSDWVKVEQNATQNGKEIIKAIHRLSIGGGTNAQPFGDVYKLLHKAPGRPYAIVLTDGAWGDQTRAINEARQCHAVPIDVIALGFGQADEEFLKKIASRADLASLTSLSKLSDAFSTIAQELIEGDGMQGVSNKLRLQR